jgi:hypothetical protein
LPILLPNPYPPPSDQVVTLTEALIREGDGVRSAVV